jgi:outer membrane protein OmpA-like peptidoglycan-associated protein
LKKKYIHSGLNGFGGSTALYAAAGFGLQQFTNAPGNLAPKLLLFTDGRENSSFYYAFNSGGVSTREEVIDLARQSKIKIMTIGFSGADDDVLKEIADLTDGGYFRADSRNEIHDIYNAIPLIMSNYYEISYKPVIKSDKRKVSISMKLNDEGVVTSDRYIYTGKYKAPALKKRMKNFTPQFLADFNLNAVIVSRIHMKRIQIISEYMKKNKFIKIELIGHTDTRGSVKYNKSLSDRRANEIKTILIKLGINKNRITVTGKSELNPIWKIDDTEVKQKENRRVEYKFYSN